MGEWVSRVSECFIVSDLEIAIASPSFGILVGVLWVYYSQDSKHMQFCPEIAFVAIYTLFRVIFSAIDII